MENPIIMPPYAVHLKRLSDFNIDIATSYLIKILHLVQNYSSLFF